MKILIPDEYVPDYNLSKEEEKKEYAQWCKKQDRQFKKLEGLINKCNKK